MFHPRWWYGTKAHLDCGWIRSNTSSNLSDDCICGHYLAFRKPSQNRNYCTVWYVSGVHHLAYFQFPIGQHRGIFLIASSVETPIGQPKRSASLVLDRPQRNSVSYYSWTLLVSEKKRIKNLRSPKFFSRASSNVCMDLSSLQEKRFENVVPHIQTRLTS